MSIFDLNDQDIEEYKEWVQYVKNEVENKIQNKTMAYSFDFKNSQPIQNGTFHWEQNKDQTKRLSNLRGSMRSSLSTLPTLGEELTGDIPEIMDFDQRISQELSITPIVLLPHKR